MSNFAMNLAVDTAVYDTVDRAVYWAVGDVVYNAVGEAVYWVVYTAVGGAVYWNVDRDMDRDVGGAVGQDAVPTHWGSWGGEG
jgi:hypothetical protein